MRPYQFAPLPKSRGLTIGAGVASGINEGLQNLAKIRMQRAQMQAHQANADAMNIYRKAQAESMRQKAMGGTAADIRLLNAISKGEHIDPSVLKPLLKDKVQTLLETAKPEEKQALAQHIEQQMNAGEVPGELMPYININANQLRSMDRTATNTSRENVAGTQATAKVESAGIYGDTRTSVARIGADARVRSAGISASARTANGGGTDVVELKNSTSRLNQLQKSLDNLNKPLPLGATIDPDAHQKAIEHTQNLINQETQNYTSIIDRIHGGGQKAAQAPGAPAGQAPAMGSTQQAPAMPKYLPSDQHGSAQEGDFVQAPGGKGYLKAVKLKNGSIGPEVDPGGQLKVYQPPQQPAPQAPQMPQGPAAPPGGGVSIGSLPGGQGGDIQPPPGLLTPQNQIPGME